MHEEVKVVGLCNGCTRGPGGGGGRGEIVIIAKVHSVH